MGQIWNTPEWVRDVGFPGSDISFAAYDGMWVRYSALVGVFFPGRRATLHTSMWTA